MNSSKIGVVLNMYLEHVLLMDGKTASSEMIVMMEEVRTGPSEQVAQLTTQGHRGRNQGWLGGRRAGREKCRGFLLGFLRKA